MVGVWQIEAGLLTMGGLIACSILGGRIIAPVSQSVQYLEKWQHVSQALNMVHQVLALEPERRPDQQLLLPDEQPTALALEGVRFAYAGSPIRQLTVDELHLASGDRVLLVGPVGSGKSTLLKILAGLYRPSEGRVRLGNADLWETDPLLVSTQIGYLPQSVHLFRGTLRSNLCLSGTAGDDRLLEVSRQLGIDAIAAGNPQGMDLPISEGGEGLSGGQRQLVALARVFINQPRIWLAGRTHRVARQRSGGARVADAGGGAAPERHPGRQHASAADGEPTGQPHVDHAAGARRAGWQARDAVAADGRTDLRDSSPRKEEKPMWFDGAANAGQRPTARPARSSDCSRPIADATARC